MAGDQWQREKARDSVKNPGNGDSFDVSQHISDSMYSIRNSNFKNSKFLFLSVQNFENMGHQRFDFVSVRPSMVGGGLVTVGSWFCQCHGPSD